MNIFFMPIIAVLVAGCNPFADFRPNSADIVKSGWARNKQPTPVKPLFCYKTLGDTVCHAEAIDGAEDRLMGSFEHMRGNPDEANWIENLRTAFESQANDDEGS